MARLADQDVRDLVESTGLDQTLFIEAGAGTGKTTLLVNRITNLVLQQGVSLGSIAAITFTEAAAAELQSRIRAAFERAHTEAADAGDFARADLCQQAIDDTDLAAITTLHGFANRILGEFSIAAGLPPRVRVLDEVASQLQHEARWQRFVDRLYDNPEHEDLLVTAGALDVALEPAYPQHVTLRDVAAQFNQNWDRLEPIVALRDRPRQPVDFSAYERAVDGLAEWIPQCKDPGDLLAHQLRKIVSQMQAIAQLDDPGRKVRLLAARRKDKFKGWGPGSGGKRLGWPVEPKVIKEEIKALPDAVNDVLDPLADDVLLGLCSLIAAETVDAAKARRREGGIEFHDLLVLARDLLRTNPEARRALHDRYTHLLLDEFQDTDPIQIELAMLIATSAEDVEGRPWSDLPVAQGRLFFVGDPKQSIYRFRRADIGLFLRARDRFAGPSGSHQLTTNFRTVAPVLEWVNAMFETCMAEEIPERQPRYEPLAPNRAPKHQANDHRPILLGGPHPDPKIRSADLRKLEADDVALAVRAILDSPGQFLVQEKRRGRNRWRPAKLDDITILLPTRTSLPFIKAALDDHSIRYRIATGTLVYETQEVVDALAALRAIDDPSDELSMVAALRSPLYGCSDVDLFTWRNAGGRWDHRRSAPEMLGPEGELHPVAIAFNHLRGLWEQRWFLTPSAMLERLLRERQAKMLAFGDTRPTDVWRRLRFLIEQARAFEESASGGLRFFTEWAELQSGSMARVHEPLLPETDEAALSIQTIHGSKGLEFPITILSGMTTELGRARSGVSVLWGDLGPPEVRLRSGIATTRHEPRADLEAAMDEAERLRLAYVAATRARDHLIVSCHHKASQAENTYGGIFHAAFGEGSTLARRDGLDDYVDDSVAAPANPAQLGFALDDRDAWSERRESMLAEAGQTRVMSATAVAKAAQAKATADRGDSAAADNGEASGAAELFDQDDDGADRPDDGVVRPRRRGRTGSAIGSAVHAVLQLTDLNSPTLRASARDDDAMAELDELVAQQAHAESVPQHAFVVGQLVRAALDSEAAQLAATHGHFKELFVAAPVQDRMVEGYVDLLIEGPDGLIVVDWKTDSVRTEADIDAKLESYELQAAAYAVALEQATGLAVAECRFVFLRTSGADERTVRDLPAAMARVRSTIASAR